MTGKQNYWALKVKNMTCETLKTIEILHSVLDNESLQSRLNIGPTEVFQG